MLQIILLNNPHHASPSMNIFLKRGFNYLTDYEIQTIIGRKNQVHVVFKKKLIVECIFKKFYSGVQVSQITKYIFV